MVFQKKDKNEERGRNTWQLILSQDTSGQKNHKTQVEQQGKPIYEFVTSQVHTCVIEGKLNHLVQGIRCQNGEHKCLGEIGRAHV